MIDLIIFHLLVWLFHINECMDRDSLIVNDKQEISCYFDTKHNHTIIVDNEIIFSMNYGVRLK